MIGKRVFAYEPRSDGDWHLIRPEHGPTLGMAPMCPCGCRRDVVVPFYGVWLRADAVGATGSMDSPTLATAIRFPCKSRFHLTRGVWSPAARSAAGSA